MNRADVVLRVVAGLLWLVAAWCALFGLLWIFGFHGLGWIQADEIPARLQRIFVYSPQGGWDAVPQIGAGLNAKESAKVGALFSQLHPIPGQDSPLGTPRNWGEIAPGGAVINLWGPTSLQHHAYMAAHVLGYAVVASIAIILARMVTDSRRGSAFALPNVRRLRLIGWLTLIGIPLAGWGSWACLHWMFATSTAADQVEQVVGFSWVSVPWWTMVVGAVVLTLAEVWRRGVQMADDVEGLV